MAGPAVTCRCGDRDNLAVLRALEHCRPGDVLVIETPKSTDVAVFGGLTAASASRVGVGGVLIDGYVRDVDEIRALGLPVWSRGARLGGPSRTNPGALGVPVSIGGMAVAPGDLVRLDGDGFVAIPKERATEVVAAAEAKEHSEAALLEQVRAGDSLLRLLVDASSGDG